MDGGLRAMEIGTFIREQRRARGITQQQLADLAGVGLNFVYQLEKNKPTVQLDCTRQVLKALGFDLTVAPTHDLQTLSRSGAWAAERPSTPRPALPWD